MDTSPEYIAMCTEAVKNIGKGAPCEGDFVHNHAAVKPNYVFVNYLHQPNDDKPEWELICKDYSCWYLLPLWRQDQLQEMVRGNLDPYCGAMLTRFMDWINRIQATYESMEQLWLAFVMHEKYGKKWTGTEWST